MQYLVLLIFILDLWENEFISASVQGLLLTVVAALPMAIFGILPQAVVADISQSDSITSGSNREGMFYAARTFCV